jgi:hypothetical protein
MLKPSGFALSAVDLRAAVMVLFVLSADFRPAAAQPLTITASLEFSQIYRPDSWQPVLIQLRNNTGQPIEGAVVLPLSHPHAAAAIRLPVSVPSHATVRANLWGYFPPPPHQQSGGVPLLSIAECRGPDGGLLARTDVLGVPISAVKRGASDGVEYGADRGELVLLVHHRPREGDAYDTDGLIGHLADTMGTPISVAGVEIHALPRQAGGLRGVKTIVLEAVDPDALDVAQRDALVAYLHGGGVVVVAAPVESVGRAGNWFDPLLPVRLIGSRQAIAIETGDAGPALKLRESLPIVEAIEGSGRVLLRGKDYVHVAVQPVGLGKVVFTSFPLNGLDEKQPQVAVLWEQLLGMRRPLWDWHDTRLGETRHQVLGSMIGRKVAPWSIAAAVAVGYVLLALAAQAMFLGPARPKAFIASIAVALIASGALLAMGMARRGDTGLQSARLAVIDVGAEGNGWQQESLAFVGKDDAKMALRPRDERVMIRPALADDGNPPTVKQQPFAVDGTGVYAERIERVWEASGPADPKLRIHAAAQLGADGLTLDVQNDLGAPLEAPLVVWNGRVLATAFLPTGRSTVRQFQLNARQVFTEAGFVTSDEAKRRAQIVAASLAPANPSSGSATEAPPMLIGWIAAPDAALVGPVDREGIQPKSMVMVRTPLRFNLSPPKSMLSIPVALVHVDTGRLPYDRAKGESVPTPQPGEWTLTFRPPPEIGRVRPTRATLSARVSLPMHSMELRKGSGRNTPVLAEWSRDVAAKEITFDCAPGDYDEDGTIGITLQVNAHEAGGSVPWQVSDLGMSFDAAEVIGPPKPIALDPPTGMDPVRKAEPESEPYGEEKQ